MVSTADPYVILATVAFDDADNYALQGAARHAELNERAVLHVIHVVHESTTHLLGGRSPEFDRAPEELTRRVSGVSASRPLRIIAHLRIGDVTQNILQTAADIDADLLVVSTHRRTGIGAVAEHVLREAHCPVLIAMTKDYHAAARANRIEAPCVDCVTVRQLSGNTQYWCERHSRSRMRPHVYEPSDARPAAGHVP
jgi:nucleotide-binding universal stress UspA family protein